MFNFQVKDSAGAKVLYVANAGERLLVDSIRVQGDSALIQMPFFYSYFKAAISPDGNLQGVWNKRHADREQSVLFRALYFDGGYVCLFTARVSSNSISSGKFCNSTAGCGGTSSGFLVSKLYG